MVKPIIQKFCGFSFKFFGIEFLFIKGGNQHIKVSQNSDVAANLSGYISLTPMRADLTAIDRMADFEENQ